MVSNRDLLQQIEHLLTDGDPNAAVTLQLSTYKEHFLSLLKFQANNSESRQQVQSRTVNTLSRGALQLDEEPDVRLALLLSDELKLDEIFCVELLLQAHQERGDLSAETAAGIYFEERRAVIASLHRLLQFHALELDNTTDEPVGARSPTCEAVFALNMDLLGAKDSEGRCSLISRLVELIKDVSLEANDGTLLSCVRDNTGELAPRTSLVQRERSQLCEILMYAVFVAKSGGGLGTKDAMQLADLMHYFALKLSNLQGTGHHHSHSTLGSTSLNQGSESLTLLHHATTSCAALLLALSPSMVQLQDAQAEAERSAMAAIAASAEVANALRLNETTGFHHLGALAWGILQLEHGAGGRGARDNVRNALAAGALRFLANDVLSSVPFQDDDVQPRELIARASLMLLLRLLGVEEDLVYQELIPGKLQQVACLSSQPPAAPGLGGSSPPGDSMVSILKVMEASLELRPELALDADLRDEKLEVFLENVPFGGCMQNPEVLVQYLHVLKAVCAGDTGSRMVFHQLMHPHMPDQLSWGKLFTVMLQYCHWFQPLEGETEESGGMQAAGEVKTMSEKDMFGLVAYLQLFSAVLQQGKAEEVASWVRQLEDKMSLRPLHEVLFQLLCHRVPHELKAALMDAIGTFASSPDAAAELWERLKATAIFDPSGAEGTGVAAVTMRYDLSYQLAEIEERAEIYPEVRAFVQLLNKLWEASGGAMPDFGRPYAHFTRFVRDILLGQLGARSYKRPREKWEIAEAGFQHMRSVLASAAAAGDLSALVAADAAGYRPPGIEVMLDMLKEARSMRTVLAVAMTGVEHLAKERQGSDCGAALEGAVLASLQLLVCALQAEGTMLKALTAAGAVDRDASLFAILKADARRLAVLTDYVRYPYSTQIQAEALRITKALAESIPNLVDLLARGSHLPMTHLSELQRMRSVHVAVALDKSLFRVPELGGDGHQGDALSVIDPRASLVLELLLSCVDLPAPNMAQLLLGFPLDGDGVAGMMNPSLSCLYYTCLTVVLKAAADPYLPHQRPRLYEQIAELIYLLAANSVTAPCMLPVLRGPRCGMLMGQLDNVLCSPLPPREEAFARVASLHSRAWLLQLAALELHSVDPMIPTHMETAQHLLGELFDPDTANEPALTYQGSSHAMEQRRARVIEVLELAMYKLEEPQNKTQGEIRRLQEEMQLQELLFRSTPVAEGGVRGTSPRGCPIIDIPAFISNVMERYRRLSGSYVGRGGAAASNEALRTACREMVSLAHSWNEFQEESIAQYSLLASWQELVEVSFSCRYEQLAAAAGAPGMMPEDPLEDEVGSMAMVVPGAAEVPGATVDASELLYEIMKAALGAMEWVLTNGMDRMAPMLCSVVQTLLSRLQLSPPKRYHEVLHQILNLLQHGRRNEGIRSGLYGALLSYLQICKGPRVRDWPQAVVDAMLDRNTRTQSVAAIDATQAELEQGNSLELQSHAPQLIAALAADALMGKESSRALVFRLLATLVATDPVVANEVHQTDLPRNMLDTLSQAIGASLALPVRQSQAACIVIESQLGLLQALCLAGPACDRSATAQYVFSTGALRCLTGCRALGTQVEELRPDTKGKPMSLRSRVARIVRPALRLLSCVMAALPSSAAVTAEAMDFVGTHHRLLGRLLQEVARGGEAELEQGCLAAGILSRLAPQLFRSEGTLRHRAKMLDEKMWALCRLFLNVDEDATNGDNSDSFNPTVTAIAQAKSQIQSLLDQRESLGLLERRSNVAQLQRLRAQLETSQYRCRMLRCYLLRYIHKIVQHIASGQKWAFPEEDEDEAMDGKAASPLSGFGFTPSAARMAMAVPGSARYPLIVSCFYQAVMDLHELVGERLRLLEFLRTAQAGDDRVDDVLDEYGNRLDSRQAAFLPEERKLEEAKITAAGVVAASERGIKQLVYICELAVALILGEGSKRVLTSTDTDLQRIAHRLKHPFQRLGQIQPEYLPPSANPNHLTLLIRQTKKFLSQHD